MLHFQKMNSEHRIIAAFWLPEVFAGWQGVFPFQGPLRLQRFDAPDALHHQQTIQMDPSASFRGAIGICSPDRLARQTFRLLSAWALLTFCTPSGLCTRPGSVCQSALAYMPLLHLRLQGFAPQTNRWWLPTGCLSCRFDGFKGLCLACSVCCHGNTLTFMVFYLQGFHPGQSFSSASRRLPSLRFDGLKDLSLCPDWLAESLPPLLGFRPGFTPGPCVTLLTHCSEFVL